jgi:periplasmic copper chaperone A
MKAVIGLFAAALMLTPAFAQDSKADVKLGSLLISQPWSRATPQGSKVAAGYLKITNTGTSPDRLTGGESSLAGRVEVHEMGVDKGVMKMRALKQGVEIPPGASIELKPGSYHLMLQDLKQPLKKGDRVEATLKFEQAGSVNVDFVVMGIGETPAGVAAEPSGHGAQGHGSH